MHSSSYLIDEPFRLSHWSSEERELRDAAYWIYLYNIYGDIVFCTDQYRDIKICPNRHVKVRHRYEFLNVYT